MKFGRIAAIAALGFFISLAGAGSAQAQSVMTTQAMPATVCVNIGYNLRVGSTDYYTGGAVSQLQSYLSNLGYFNAAYLGTGRYGGLTVAAVVQYQRAHGITPTGTVGPITRASIYKESCGGIVVPPVNQAPGISGLTPTSGPVGTQLTIFGYNFSSNNTVLIDGAVVASNVPSKLTGLVCITYPCGGSQSITITIPEYTSPYCAPGMYCIMMVRQLAQGPHQITVQNDGGTSNAVTFTVTGNTAQQFSITGIDAPPTLPLGTTGTWTVRATVSSNSGNLRYSVVWGDEANYAAATSLVAPQPTQLQTSASFTHAYSRAGNFTPVFTVTDDAGHTASVSSTIVVTPLY
jgi:peptidoglycan hydrolase-like protein with peptidoglycan-binding domain